METSGEDRKCGLRIHWRVWLAMIPPLAAGALFCRYPGVLWIGFVLCAIFSLGAMAAHRKFRIVYGLLLVLSSGMLLALIDVAAATAAGENHPESDTTVQK